MFCTLLAATIMNLIANIFSCRKPMTPTSRSKKRKKNPTRTAENSITPVVINPTYASIDVAEDDAGYARISTINLEEQ
jgi:hypothetical protein